MKHLKKKKVLVTYLWFLYWQILQAWAVTILLLHEILLAPGESLGLTSIS